MFVFAVLGALLVGFGAWDSGVVDGDGVHVDRVTQESAKSEFGRLIGTQD